METQDLILQKAREIFFNKGLAGARMQEIADSAGINKAMLHYYFKTKEQLFERVFEDAFRVFVEQISEVLNSESPLPKKIRNYVNRTIDMLKQNPGIPVFVVNELYTNPERVADLFAGHGKINVKIFREQLDKHSGKTIDTDNVLIDMVALCVYPFIVAPVFKKMLQKSQTAYGKLLESRKEHIIQQLLHRLNLVG